MPSGSIARLLKPWALRREREAERVRLLRLRDGDGCARCRRPVRFDLPEGHDQGPKIEAVAAAGAALDQSRITHRRCFAAGLDHTAEVTERIKRKAEAALLSKPRKRKRQAA